MLELYTADNLPELVRALAGVLAEPGRDPMAPEMVAVPSAGMRTWLPLRLARELGRAGPDRTDGVAANIELPFPGVLRQRVIAAHRHAPDGSADDVDPWEVERLVWAILEVCDLGEVALPTGLASPGPGASRYSAARQVADLFDRYHLHRPHMILGWADDEMVDGVGGELATSHRWQAELWKSVRKRLDAPSPPERLADALPQLRAGELEVDLPARVSVFGMSLLPGGPGFLDLAEALAARHDVHLFVVEPSVALRSRFAAAVADPARETTAADTGTRMRAAVDPADAVTHPLLRSWARLHYETASVIEDAVGRSTLPVIHHGETATQAADTLLGRLQADLRGDLAPSGDLVPSVTDDSVRFHTCHGASRQVEVLHDTVVGLLVDHPHLQEDDILVVCPDLVTFAPLVEATFGPSAHTGTTGPQAPAGPLDPPTDGGSDSTPPSSDAPSSVRATVRLHAGSDHPRIRLRYRMSDRALGASVPMVGAFEALLELLGGRFDAPAVLDFLTLEPVRTRQGLDEADLATITRWVLDLHVRWGLDPGHRERHGLPATITANTWQVGVERLMLGAAVDGGSDPAGGLTDTLGAVIPHGVEGSDTGVAGRVADVLWRLARLADRVEHDRSLTGWMELLTQAVDEFLSVPREQQWQMDRLLASLGGIVESAGDPPSATPLSFSDIRRLVAERLGSLEGRPSFFRGGVTVSSLTPLRWIPHRVIIMLGMDAPALSARPPEGDDLAAQVPVVGDRDSRSELRQALLETVLAATEHLVVIRDGFDVRTNQEVPAPVAVAELGDAFTQMVHPDHRKAVAERLEVRHPRQPFDEGYFSVAPNSAGSGAGGSPEAGVVALPRSFDVQSGGAAIARRQRSTEEVEFLAEPLTEIDLDVVTLEDLQRFLRSPIGHFLDRRLELRVPRREDAPLGTLDMTLTGLDGYAAGSRLLRRVRDGADIDEAVAIWSEVERRTGSAPPGRVGDAALRKIELEVRRLWAGARRLGVRHDPDEPVRDIDVELPGGIRVVGQVRPGLDPTEDDPRRGPAHVAYVKRRADQVLSIWLELAALTLADPGTGWRGVLATKAASGDTTVEGIKTDEVQVAAYEMAPSDPAAAATTALERAIDLYRRGMREPLPIFRKVSEELVRRPHKPPDWPGRNPQQAEQIVYGQLDAGQLVAIDVREGDPQGPATDRAHRFAEHLFGTLDATMQEVSDGE